MNAQVVVLWSDVLVWLLVAASSGLGIWMMRQAPMRLAWSRVLSRPAAMSALTLLLLFVLVGLLDSFHYRLPLPGKPGDKPSYAVETLSVLDGLLADLRAKNEKTYSAPLATRLYAKEMLGQPAGGQLRDYPRLRFGGQHLVDEQAWGGDLLVRVGRGWAGGALCWALCAGLLLCVLAWRGQGFQAAVRQLWHGEGPVAWRSVLVTLGVFLLLAGPVVALAGGYHVLGTDKVGQDVLYQALKGVRTALVIGLVTTLVTLPLAIVLGVAAGYFRGWVDDLIQYVYTVLNSIPSVLLIAAAVLMMQVVIDTHPQWFSTAAERADLRLLALCFIMGLMSWTGLCRLLRAETLKLRELEYIQAARSMGLSGGRILMRHVLPNVMHLVIISVVTEFSMLVLTEAVLSYIDIGVDPSMISFGTMINNARLELGREPVVWWSLATAFSFMFVLVLSANLFADAVRDAFDPRGN